MAEEEDSKYIDYEAFLDPDFSATSFANTLVLATNNANDSPLDLSTPLSRVLFDVQEVDTTIDTLTTKSALPLLQPQGHCLFKVITKRKKIKRKKNKKIPLKKQDCCMY